MRDNTPDRIDEDFAERLRSVPATTTDLALARERYGEEVPGDVLEMLARQRAQAQPILEQYYLIYDKVPTLAESRAAMLQDVDTTAEILAGIDVTDLNDPGDPEEVSKRRRRNRSRDKEAQG